MGYQVHEVQWTDEKVKRFWDFYNNYPAFEELWFSRAVGKGIINFVEKYFKIKGDVLDYGIGKGHFASYLLEHQEIRFHACDFSDETVNNINSQFSGRANFKGCFLVQGFPSGFDDKQFDVVFLIESIEHFTDDYLTPTLKEAYRILKPGGRLVITTPNNENLPQQHVICPDCGGVFHRVQHVRSFNAQILEREMLSLQLRTVFCGGTDFHEFGDKGALYKIRNRILKTLKKGYQAPHLIYIGQK